METQEYYMNRALELAKNGWGRTNPNPLVGAVIARDGKIVAEGFHKALGSAHAEADALNNLKGEASGCTLYVNLEPCSHYGRTPPCAEAIIRSGIKKVVVAMADPNPKVAGKGIQMLKDAGIEVVTGVFEDKARKLNEIFIKYITQKRPFVILKAAMTLDGKTATSSGDSKWISNESSRMHAHHIRDRSASIMVGINTVLRDNPTLTARLDTGKGKDPVRIVADSTGKIPVDSNVINAASEAGVILATTSKLDRNKEQLLMDKGVRIIKADGIDGRVDLPGLMDELYKLNIDSVLLEGGSALNAAALEAGIIDKVMLFIAPKIVGGECAPTPIGGKGIQLMRDALKLKNISFSKFDEDILIEGYLN